MPPRAHFTGIPQEPHESESIKKNCLIVDDLVEEAQKSHYLGHLLRDGSHHDNCTLILVSHWCCGSSNARRQRQQMDYMCLFRFSADKKAVYGLDCQIAFWCFRSLYGGLTRRHERAIQASCRRPVECPLLRPTAVFRCEFCEAGYL